MYLICERICAILNGYTTKGFNLNMDIKRLIKGAICSACIYFTLITAAYMLIMLFITTGDDSPAIEAHRVLLFFVFSALWALADVIRYIKAIPRPLAAVIHFGICLFGFYACFMLPVGMRPSNVLTGLILFAIVYWIYVGIKAFFKSRFKTNREASTKYEDQFKKKK